MVYDTSLLSASVKNNIIIANSAINSQFFNTFATKKITMDTLCKEKHSIIDYSAISKKFPWIVERDRKCIIGPDTDGILCGLFMSAFFNWEVVGYYDGKDLALRKKIKPSDCVFLDMEIFRKNCKSIGQHMVLYNKNSVPTN